MQPRRKRRLGPKGTDLAKQLQERFLSQIFGLRRIPSHHPQTQSVYAAAVQFVEPFESRRIALLGSSNYFRLRQVRHFRLSGIHLRFTLKHIVHVGSPPLLGCTASTVPSTANPST